MVTPTRKWICRAVTGAAFLLYGAALAIALVGTQGWLGFEPHWLHGIWLVFLGMPWSVLITVIVYLELPSNFGLVLVVLFPILNLVLLFRLCRNPNF